MSDLNCPYCDAELSVCHDDGFGYEEDVRHEMTCRECEKSFVFSTWISFHYEALKADCLNGAPHRLKQTNTYPRQFTKMRCIDCGHEEPLPSDAME